MTALAVAVTVAFNNFTGLIIMKHCKMSLYMSFLMTGGMLIPFLYGVIFLDEKLTALRVIAMLMLLLALFMPVVEKGGEKASRLGIILCVCVFLSNGINSTVSKIHQISPQALGTNDFSFWLYALSTLLGAAAFAVCFASGKLKTKRQAAKKENTTKNTVFRISLILVTGTVMAASSLFNLTGARTMDAAVLYPMVTGGTITLTSLAGWLIYKEKASTASIISVVVSLTGTVLFAL